MIADLRSDTITRPTPEMYEAMMTAPLGDDVLGDEPSVTRLEEISAEKMGKEAAVFVPSGTMANQIAVKTWISPGDAVILEEECHIQFYESGSIAAHAGALSWTLPSTRGVMDPQRVADRYLPGSIHSPTTKLLCVENTHNRAGGSIVPMETMREYRRVCDETGMKLHIDGARLFNASIALGVDAKDVAKYSDSVTFCLSKGLSCPVGSVLCGDRDFISKARYVRKRLGGAMRQSGILAACGIYALDNMVDRLADDHRRAKEFAEHVTQLDGFEVDMEGVQTNMVMVNTPTNAADYSARLGEVSVRCMPVAKQRLRFVFHREIGDDELEYAKSAMSELSKGVHETANR
ncbi:MAG: beta-eliminating lyase-related protein [Armatimonadota bacterium]|nr:beta-eliminating lyase-related protein [Armatimonadota bacterium]